MRLGRLSLLLFLMSLSSLIAQEQSGQWFPIPLTGGLNTIYSADQAPLGYAQEAHNVIVEGNAVKMLPGASRYNNTIMDTFAVYAMFRYYNAKEDIKQILVACGNTMFYNQDSVASIRLGSNEDSVYSSQGDSMIHGINTRWVALKGEHDGEGMQIYLTGLDASWHTVEKIYSDVLLEIEDTVFVTVSDTGYADIGIPTHGSFVDFAQMKDLAFIANGVDPVFRWDGNHLNHDYYMVDSFTADSCIGDSSQALMKFYCSGDNALQGYGGAPLDSLGRKRTGMYAESTYNVIYLDTSTANGYSVPMRIKTVDSTFPYTLVFCDYLDETFTMDGYFEEGHKGYIVKPAAQYSKTFSLDHYAVDIDTVYSGFIDSSFFDCNSTNESHQIEIYDYDQSWSRYEFDVGTYVFKLLNVGTDGADNVLTEDLRRGVTCITCQDGSGHNGLRFARPYSATLADSVHYLGDSGTAEYIIMRYYYYPRSQYVETHNNRMWFASDSVSDDRIIFSAPNAENQLRPDYSNVLNYIYVDRGSKPHITHLSSRSGQLAIYKNNQIWGLYGGSTYDYQLKKVYEEIGCVSPYSFFSYIGDYFAGKDGLYFYDGNTPTYVTSAVREYFTDSMNENYSHKIQCGIMDDLLFIGYPNGSDTNVSRGLVYNFEDFWGTVDSLSGGNYIVMDAKNDGDTALFGTRRGFIMNYDKQKQYHNGYITSKYKTAWFDMDMPETWKKITRISVGYHKANDSAGTDQIIMRLFTEGKADTVYSDSIRAGDDDAEYDRKIFDLPVLVEGYTFAISFESVNCTEFEITDLKLKWEAIREDD